MFDAKLLGESREQFIDRLDAADTFRRWADLVPDLASDSMITSIDDVFRALAPQAPRRRWDPLLLSLLRLAAADGADQSDAVLAVVHAVACGAHRLVRRGFDEGLVLGELTIRIRLYPWRTRRHAVAANLLRDTERGLCFETAPAWMRTREHLQRMSEVVADDLLDPSALSDGRDGSADDDDIDLVDLLVWAERTGVLDARAVLLLVEYHCGRAAGEPGHRQVAERFGVTVRTSKRHYRAALNALRAALPQYLAA